MSNEEDQNRADKQNEPLQQNANEEESSDNYVSVGLGIGLCLGVALGELVFHNIALGIGIGISLGLAVGSGMQQKNK